MAIGGGDLGSASGSIVLLTDKAEANVKRLQGTVTQFGASAGDSLNRVATGLGLLGAAKGIGNIFAGMIGGAADFEQQLSAVAAALGGIGGATGITEAQFKALNDEAGRIGSTTSVGATDAARAMELMAKAGVSLEAILNGGAQAAVNIAEATGEPIEQSAATMSSMLLLFQDLGIEADRAADIIATGMGSSNATLSEFETGIARLAPTIKATGLSFEEATAAVAYFNSLGLSAAETGSSLNAAFLEMASPTAEAATAMEQLGIAAFDLEGNFVGFPTLFDQVNAATQGMSEQQKAATLELIFGRDALDVMTIAANEGSTALRGLEKDMAAMGTAAKASADRLDNLRGDTEELGGVAESISNTFSGKLLPALRELTQGSTAALRAFAGLPESLQFVSIAGVGLAGAIAGIAGVLTLAGPQLAQFGQTLKVVRAAMFGLVAANPAVLAAIAAVGIGVLAYKSDFGGVATYIDKKVGFIGRRLGYFRKAFDRTADQSAVDTLLGFGMGDGDKTIRFFGRLGDAVGDLFGIQGKAHDGLVKRFTAIGQSAARGVVGVEKMRGALHDVSRIIQRDGLAEGIDRLFGDKGQDLVAGFGRAVGAIPTVFGRLLGSITTGFGPLDSILANAGAGFEQLGRSIELAFSGDFSLAGETLQNAVDRFLIVGDTVFDVVVDVAVSIGKFVAGEIPSLWDAVKRFAFGLAGGNSDAAAVDTLLAAGGVGDGLTIGEVGVQIQSWAVDAVVGVYDAIKTWVSGNTGGLGANTGGIGASGRFSGGGLPISGVGISVASWAVSSAVGVYDAIKTWVSGHTGGIGANTGGIGAGGSFSTGGIPISGVGVSVASWAVDVAVSILPYVQEAAGVAWAAVKATATTIGDVLIDIGSWTIGTAITILPYVQEAVGVAWSAVKATTTTIGGVIVDIGSWTIGTVQDLFPYVQEAAGVAWSTAKTLASTIGDALVDVGSWLIGTVQPLFPYVQEAAGIAWSAVKETASTVSGVVVDIASWVTKEATAGTLVSSVKAKADELLASAGVEVTDFKLTIGALGIENVDFSAVTDFFSKPIEFPAGTEASAQEWGYKIGDKIQGLVRSIVNSLAGGGGGGGQPTTAAIIGHGNAEPQFVGLQTVVEEFLGGLIEGLLVNVTATIDKEVAAAQGKIADAVAPIGDLFDSILSAITGVFGGGSSGLASPEISAHGTGSPSGGSVITDLIAGIFDFELPTLPSWVTDPSELLGDVAALVDAVVAAGLRVLRVWGDLKAALTPDLSALTQPSLPGWATDLSWLNPLDDAADAIHDIGDKFKDAWDWVAKNKNEPTNPEDPDNNGYEGNQGNPKQEPGGGNGPSPGSESKAPSGAAAAAEFLGGFTGGLSPGAIGGAVAAAFGGAAPGIGAAGRGTGVTGGQGVGLGVTDAGPEVARRLQALFGLGEGPAGTEGGKAGAAYAGAFNAAAIIKAPVPAAPGAPQNPNATPGAAPAVAPAAPAPVVFPAPNLTQYIAGMAQAAIILSTTVAGLGGIAAGMGVSLGAGASAATAAFNGALAAGFAAGEGVAAFGAAVIAGAAVNPLAGIAGEFGGLGSNAGAAFADALAGAAAAAFGAGAALGAAAASGARGSLGIASPSKVFTGFGDNAVSSFLDPFRRRGGEAARTVGGLMGALPSPSVSTSRMLGAQQVGRGAGGSGGVTIINVVPPPDGWIDIVRKSERGDGAATYVDGLMPAFAGMMG